MKSCAIGLAAAATMAERFFFLSIANMVVRHVEDSGGVAWTVWERECYDETPMPCRHPGFAMVKAITPRYRYDQLMRLGWKVFLPISLAAVAVVAGVLVAFDMAPVL